MLKTYRVVAVFESPAALRASALILSQSPARTAARGAGPDKDLLSYLFFDQVYARRLLELGRRDAAAAHDELVSLFQV